MSSSYSRRASHAGSWYSNDGEELDGQLEGWLEEASTGPAKAAVRAVIAPHAGYSYSGHTAAFAYRHMNPDTTRRVFVLGPSHHVYIAGCALSTAEKLETPVGDLICDKKVSAALMATGQFEEMTPSMDEAEHSIEMHLPYIAKVMAGRTFTVVTIVVGATEERAEADYGALLAPYLQDPDNFFVISSDFCHWGSRFRYQPYDPTHGAEVYEYIEWLDRQGMSLIEARDLAGYYRYLAEHKNTICGRHPIGVLLQAMAAIDATAKTAAAATALKAAASEETEDEKEKVRFRVAFVRYAQSSAVMSKRDSSVSYASAVVQAGPPAGVLG
ncbi:unnamed protein product [Phaeothamnion confervicola]